MARLKEQDWIQLRKLYIEGKDITGKTVTISYLAKTFKINRKYIYEKMDKDSELFLSSNGELGCDWKQERNNYMQGIASAVMRVSSEEIKSSLFKEQKQEIHTDDIQKSSLVESNEKKVINSPYKETEQQVNDSREKTTNLLAGLKTRGIMGLEKTYSYVEEDIDNKNYMRSLKPSEKKSYIDMSSAVINQVDKIAGIDKVHTDGVDTVVDALKLLSENL